MCQPFCQDSSLSSTQVCIMINNTEVILDFSVKSQILQIESQSSAFVFLNFFPSTLLFVSLSIVTAISYLKFKDTNVNLSMLIFTLNVETFSCLLVTLYALIYASLGLKSVWMLFVVHACHLCFQACINFAVIKGYLVSFKLTSGRIQELSDNSSK